jgi:excisionase family DNA binding protein
MHYEMKDGESKLVNVKEARAILRLGRTSVKVYEIVKNNNIRCFKFGRRWEISRQDLYNFINQTMERSTQ